MEGSNCISVLFYSNFPAGFTIVSDAQRSAASSSESVLEEEDFQEILRSVVF